MRLLSEVGLAVLDSAPDGWPEAAAALSHCGHVGEARRGKAFYVPVARITCPLARFCLGSEVPADEMARTLVQWGDAADVEIGRRFLDAACRLAPGDRVVCYSPLSPERLRPQVVVRFGSPAEIMPLVRRITVLTGKPVTQRAGGVGAMCVECTATPLATGQPNVSVGCAGSRPSAGLLPDEMMLAVPTHLYELLTA